MEHTFRAALGESLSALFVSLAGIHVILRFEKWGQKNNLYFICPAAGPVDLSQDKWFRIAYSVEDWFNHPIANPVISHV